MISDKQDFQNQHLNHQWIRRLDLLAGLFQSSENFAHLGNLYSNFWQSVVLFMDCSFVAHKAGKFLHVPRSKIEQLTHRSYDCVSLI